MADTPQTPPPPPPIVILKTGETTYEVSLTVDKLTVMDSQSAALVVWLLKRTEDETILFDFHCSSSPSIRGFSSIIHLANAIYICKAKTITTVNRIFCDVSAFLLFTVDELVWTPFGMIQFLPTRVTNPISSEAVSLQFAYMLLDKARDNGYLSDVDVTFVKDGKTVIKTSLGK